MKFVEGDLAMDIPDVVGGGKFDGGSHGLRHCMKAVDFVVELRDRYLFIEFKDPQHPHATPERRAEFIQRLCDKKLDEDLKYKYRDSFLYEWASGRARKPIYYLVLIALDTLDGTELLNRTEALRRKLPMRGPSGWQHEIVRWCGVFNLESWNRRFPSHPVSRVSAAEQDGGTAP